MRHGAAILAGMMVLVIAVASQPVASQSNTAASPQAAQPPDTTAALTGGDLISALQNGTLRQLTTAPSEDVEPKWSPDGSKLAFASNRTDTWNVWTVPMTTSAAPVPLITHYPLSA